MFHFFLSPVGFFLRPSYALFAPITPKRERAYYISISQFSSPLSETREPEELAKTSAPVIRPNWSETKDNERMGPNMTCLLGFAGRILLF